MTFIIILLSAIKRELDVYGIRLGTYLSSLEKYQNSETVKKIRESHCLILKQPTDNNEKKSEKLTEK